MRLATSLLLTGLASLAFAADEPPLTARDFARGIELQPAGDDGLQAVLLPRRVYQHVVRRDLGDCRVLNAAGREVPHAMRPHDVSRESNPDALELPLFPVTGKSGQPLDDVSLQIERSEGGTVLQLRTSTAEAREGGTVLAWILDASGVEKPLRHLDLQWGAASGGFVANVRVEASDDLSRWRSVVSRASIAGVQFSGHALTRRGIELPRTSARYLRLSSVDGDAFPVALSGVRARPAADRAPPERRWAELSPKGPSDDGNTFRYDTGGPMPIDRIEIALPQRNTLVEVELLSSASDDDRWVSRFRGVAYRVTVDGQEVSSSALQLPITRDRHWKLVVSSRGGGLGAGEPGLRVGWVPEQLLFVARGEAPFLLAFGSQRAKPSTFGLDSLLGLAPGGSLDTLPASTVTIGDDRVLGGDDALAEPPPPVPWKTYSLWAVLLVGVAVLGWMAVRLARQLGSPSD